MTRRRKRKLTIEQTKGLWRQGIPDDPETAKERRLDIKLLYEFPPWFLAALREGRLLPEPPGYVAPGAQRSGKVATMRDLLRRRERRRRGKPAAIGPGFEA
jgi:hypothetical protein